MLIIAMMTLDDYDVRTSTGVNNEPSLFVVTHGFSNSFVYNYPSNQFGRHPDLLVYNSSVILNQRLLANEFAQLGTEQRITLLNSNTDNYSRNAYEMIDSIAFHFDLLTDNKIYKREFYEIGGSLIMDLLNSNDNFERYILVNLFENDIITTLFYRYRKIQYHRYVYDRNQFSFDFSYYRYKYIAN